MHQRCPASLDRVIISWSEIVAARILKDERQFVDRECCRIHRITPENEKSGLLLFFFSPALSLSLSLSRWLVEYSGPSRCRRAGYRFCPAWMDRFGSESGGGRIAIPLSA